MKEHILRLAKQSFVYGLSGTAVQVVGLVTFPVLARSFSPSTYGVLEVATAAVTVVLAVVDAGLTSAAQRSYYDHDAGDTGARGRVLFTALVATASLSLVAAAAAIVAREQLADWMFGGDGRQRLVVVAALTIPLANIAGFLRQTMRLRFRAWQFAVSSALSSVFAAAVVLIGVTQFDLGVTGVFLGFLVGHAIALVYGAVVVRDQLAVGFSTPELRRMLAFGAPLIPNALAMWALMLIDRLMLQKISGLDEVGEYAAANRVVSILLLVSAAFATAFGPYALSLYSEDRELEGRVRARTLTFLVAGLTLGGLLLSLFGREVLAVVAPDYREAYRAVALLALGAVAFGATTVTMSGISFARRTSWFATLAVAAALVNIGLNLVLMPPFGLVGAAAATAAAFGFLVVAYYVVSQRLYPTPYDGRTALLIVAAAAAFAPLGLVDFSRETVEVAAKLAAVAAFLVVLRLLGVAPALPRRGAA